MEKVCEFCNKFNGRRGKFCSVNCRHKYQNKYRYALHRERILNQKKTPESKFALMKWRFRSKMNSLNPEQRKKCLKKLMVLKESLNYKINILNDLLKNPKIKIEVFITELELKKEVERIKN